MQYSYYILRDSVLEYVDIITIALKLAFGNLYTISIMIITTRLLLLQQFKNNLCENILYIMSNVSEINNNFTARWFL
jgi:hypothetical protein